MITAIITVRMITMIKSNNNNDDNANNNNNNDTSNYYNDNGDNDKDFWCSLTLKAHLVK